MGCLKIGEIVNLISKNQAPVIICDTCALLDIMRLPIRSLAITRLQSNLNAISNIYTMIKQKQIYLIAPHPVETEWVKNAKTVKDEVKKSIDKVATNYEMIKVSAEHHGLSMPKIDFYSHSISQKLFDLSECLINTSIKICQEEGPSLKATKRALGNIPPAKKGKIPDCLLYEHMIELVGQLNGNGFSKKCIFITSNTNDFCDSSGYPKTQIKSELLSLSIQFCTAWDWVKKEIV